jgi:hypothetical protein
MPESEFNFWPPNPEPISPELPCLYIPRIILVTSTGRFTEVLVHKHTQTDITLLDFTLCELCLPPAIMLVSC